jgi:hypothetical protein
MAVFSPPEVSVGVKTTIFPLQPIFCSIKMKFFQVDTSLLPLKTSEPPANLSFSYAECAMGIKLDAEPLRMKSLHFEIFKIY